MTILVADTIFPKGHKKLNEKLISFLAEENQVKVIDTVGYYSTLSNKIKKYYLPLLLNISTNFYLNLFLQFINSLLLIFRCFFIKHDAVIFFTFDTIVFPFLRMGFINKKVYVIHHNNADHLLNKSKLMFFKTYMNKIQHIVFLPFIKDFLISKGVSESRIHILEHPITYMPTANNGKVLDIDSSHRKVFSGLGHANDEDLIQKIISHEEKTHLLELNSIYVVMRSQVIEYDNNTSLKVIKGYLPRDEYESYYRKSNAILVLYSPFFQNRFSGIIMDALTLRKRVIGNDIPIVRYFSNCFPTCCEVFNSIEELFDKIIHSDFDFPEKSYEYFRNQYSDELIKQQWNEVFKIREVY